MVRVLRTIGLLLISTALAAGAAEPEQKSIRLRNEKIITGTQRVKPRTTSARPVSGLFLLQFTGPFQEHWRNELKQKNVTLLRFVPDDAFVVRLHDCDLSVLEKLPFVHWIGDYKSHHKIHSSLFPNVANGKEQENLQVRVLLSPDASPQESARMRGLMTRFDRESVTRLGRIIDGSVNSRQLATLADTDVTLWIEPARAMKLFDEISTKITAGEDGDSGTLAWVHQLGYKGTGVTIAVADSGLQEGDAETMHPDLAGRVTAFYHYGTLSDAADEHSHGTHVTGIIAGDASLDEKDEEGNWYGLGVAPGAEIVAQRLFDGDGAYHAPPSFAAMTRDAVRSGAEIGSNSWGDDTQGRYDLSAAEFDALVRDADTGTPGDQPYILEFSAGNAGPGVQTIGSPAVAKNVIATGATENDRFNFFIYDSGRGTMADFSSRGPCEDGRIKPDVVAPGTWIASLRSSLANDDNAWGPISENYLYQGGTSQAGPHVSGAAALFVQYYRENITNATPSPALVKAALINSAVDIDDGASTTSIPNNDEGWGRIDMVELIDSSRSYEFVDQSVLLTSGQVFEKRVLVGSSDEPLRITLTYSDVPGFPATIPALVNDLDLEVIAPNGASYHGNQFNQGESVPNNVAFDNINNVEAVHLFEPPPGEYVVRVHARNVPEDARIDTAPIDQDFALVISAEIPFPGAGVLFFNQKSYRAPATMELKLIDPNLAGQSSVTVQVRSSTETGGENYTLHASGSTGTFTNKIQTITGAPIVDGRLQVTHNDTIEAVYSDAAPAGLRIAEARADLFPPILSDVSVSNRFGRTFISWVSDEPSDTVVYFGTNSSLSTSVTNRQLATFHEIALENLTVGATYFFVVSSADEAGNRTTNNNAGLLFSFQAGRAAMILLVDSYTDQFFPIPPLSGYTDALDQIGLSYEVWDATSGSSPTLNDLRPFQAVIWRVSEFEVSLSPLQRSVLTNYLAQGGGLFIASMEVLTRLDESGGTDFRTNVLRVLNYDADVEAPAILGVDSEPITSGVDVTLDYTPYEDEFKQLIVPADISDSITLAPDASPIFFEPFGGVVGLRYPKVGKDSDGRVVFLSFPLDAIPLTGTAPDTRGNILRNVISFLVPGVNGLATIALDSPSYTIPSLTTVELADSDLVGSNNVNVTFYCNTEPAGKTITLHETVRPGLFRGTISLIAHTNPSSASALRVQSGDIIRAEYTDHSSGSLIKAVAEVDTTSPVISDVEVAPEYQEATITWSTSKPADALVQFGESAFLNRTAYDPGLNDVQSVTLTGLQSDKTYFFQVISRDQAGNTTIDDNNGALYSFRTLTPYNTPWIDNLEGLETNWIVLDGEPGTTTWQLGTPDNGWETSAHSGTKAWGSNLEGNVIDLGDTSLIGPAVAIPAGAQATLKFWHSHDFSSQSDQDIYEFGSVQISTNNGNAWIELAAFEELSDGWKEVQINLSAFAGRVVRIGFYYGFFSLEGSNHPGWLIDDISITVNEPNNGTIGITNNLAQSSFTLTGPVSRSGTGWSTIVSNAPPGTYVVSYNAVPFYQTPGTQTNVLSPAGSLFFAGNYTFADANGNGISDAWEQTFFGEVTTNRTAQTDSDLDGRTDYAEFMAGTLPNDPTSLLKFRPPALFPDRSLELGWNAVPGRAYQLQGSSNALFWSSVSSWIRATGTNQIYNQPPYTNGSPYLFRLEVRP